MQALSSLPFSLSIEHKWLTMYRTRPQPEHTELEEELHEKARIDYDRVAIVSFCIDISPFHMLLRVC